MELDHKDRELLQILDQNSRCSFADAARQLSLSEQAIAYRVDRMKSTGLLKQCVTFVNSPRLGLTHYKVYLKFLSVKEEAEERLLRFLCQQQNVLWVVSMSGRYDISFSLLSRNVIEYAELYRRLESQFGRFIREKNVATVIVAPGYTRAYLSKKGKREERFYGSTAPDREISLIEARILKVLSQDARISLKSLAEQTSLTVDIVRYRLKKLEESGLIVGYTVLLDLAKLGYDYYVLFLYFHGITKQVEQRLKSFAASNGNVRFFVKVIGDHDFQIELEVRGVAELDTFLANFRKTFAAHLRNLEILRITKEHKFDFFPFDESYFG